MSTEGPRSFARMLEEVADGDLQADVSVATHRLVSQLQEMARETGIDASGSITLRLDFTVDPKRNIEITGGITTKAPSAPKRTANYWVSPGGNVAFEPPSKDRKGPVREVGRNHEAPRDIAGREGT